jgi:hypothetical protein
MPVLRAITYANYIIQGINQILLKEDKAIFIKVCFY